MELDNLRTHVTRHLAGGGGSFLAILTFPLLAFFVVVAAALLLGILVCVNAVDCCVNLRSDGPVLGPPLARHWHLFLSVKIIFMHHVHGERAGQMHP